EDRAARRWSGQPSGVYRHTLSDGLIPANLFTKGFHADLGLLDEFLQRTVTHHFPKVSADYIGGLESEQLGGAVIGEKNALLHIQGDDAFHHATQNGSQLLAVLFDLSELICQASTHVVERSSQEANLVESHGEDALPVVSG